MGNTGHISVVSSAFFQHVNNVLVTRSQPQAVGSNRPAWELYAGRTLDILIPPAHAGVGEFLWNAINWVIPFDSFGRVIEQLALIGKPGFEPFELALASVEAASIIPIPPAKALRVVAKPFRAFIAFAKPLNNEFIRHFGGVLGRTMQQVWHSKSFDRFLDVLPFLIIAAEMYSDDEAREGLKLIVESIQSEDDLMAWIDYLRLPVNGWDGGPDELPLVEDPEPTPDDGYTIEWNSEIPLSASLSPSLMDRYAGRALDFLIPWAEAAESRAIRVGVMALRPLLRAARQTAARLERAGNRKEALREIVSGVKRITEAARHTDWADARKLVFDPRTLGLATAKGAKNAVLQLYRRAQNLRISPLAIAGIVSYLESRRDCSAPCTPLERPVALALNTIYARAFTRDLTNSNRDFVYSTRENGWFFHLAVLAYYQLSFEFLNNTAHQPLNAERRTEVPLFLKTGSAFTPFGKPYVRSTDIVLRGESGIELIETKSYKGPANTSYYAQWDLSRGKALRDEEQNDKSNHRQFFLDHVAIAERGEADNLAGDFKWWFHGFQRATISGYDSTDVRTALAKLKTLPKGVGKAGPNSLGVDTGNPTVGLDAKADVFTVRAMLLDQFKTQLFDGMGEQIYEQMAVNSTHDQTP